MLKVIMAVTGVVVLVAAAWPMLVDPEVDVLNQQFRKDASGQFVQLGAGITHYEIGGPRTGQAVVLVHGASVPYYIWDDTYSALVDAGYRVVRYDQFGRGYSDRPDVVYDRRLLEGQLRELITALALTPPVVLAGVSMGGAVSVGFTASDPEIVRALVLVDPFNQAADIGLLRWPLIGEYLMSVSVAPGMAEGQYDDLYRPERFPGWADRYRVQMRFKGFRRATLSIYRHFVTGDVRSRYDAVGKMGKPVLLIWGEHDHVVPTEQHAAVRDLLGAELFLVPEAGHIPQVERPEVVNPRIIGFLRSLAAGGE